MLCHRRFSVIYGASSTRWNDIRGTQPGNTASGWSPHVDGDRRGSLDSGPGRGVAGGPPPSLVSEHCARVSTSLAQWWTFLEQRGEEDSWQDAGVPTVSGFLAWLRNGRVLEHHLVASGDAPSAETLEARLAALISFYRWQGAVFGVPVADRLMRGRPHRNPARGLLAHLDSRSAPTPSSLVRVRRTRGGHGRPPLLLPHQIQTSWTDALLRPVQVSGRATCATGCCSRCSPRPGCVWVNCSGCGSTTS